MVKRIGWTAGLLLTLLGAEDLERYRDPVFTEIAAHRDIVYRQTTDAAGQRTALKLDVYRPEGDDRTDRPAVIWVHGGGLREGSKDQPGSVEVRLAHGLVRRGYVAVNINYRLRANPDAEFNAAMRDAMTDVATAVEWVTANAAELGVDPKRIILAGYSAGAEIVTNLCYTPWIEGFDARRIAAVVDLAGNTLFYGDPAEGAPPCLIVHGTADDINRYDASRELGAKLAAAKVSCTLVPLEGVDHFFNRDETVLDEVEAKIATFLRPHAP